jgi:3-hydroxyacyl-[acyl-carrier-protein] dehydratase
VTTSLDLADIMRFVPHRYPFAMLDRIVALEPGKRVVAHKNVSRGDPLGVNPRTGARVLPPEMLIETVGQAAMVLVLATVGLDRKIVPLFVGCEGEFHDEVGPGCRLEVEATLEKVISNAAIVSGRATVGDRLVAELRLTAGLLEGRAL